MALRSLRLDKEWIEMADISKEARETYLNRRKQDVQKCRTALEAGDWDFIARVGHKIKGNAETFGFDTLTEIGRKLESYAQSQNADSARETIDQFDKLVDALSEEPAY